MAKPAVTVISLCLLFAVSYARFPSDLTENYVTSVDSHSLPEFDPKTTNSILLPSDKPESKSESESEPVVGFSTVLEPETTESKLPEISEESTTESETESVPLTVISFRPVNRQFPQRPMVPFRHRRGCRHSHQFKRFGGPRDHKREIPYGNDMILSGGGDLSSDSAFRGGEGQIPARWVRFHHGGARFPFKHDVEGREEMMRPHHHRHSHRHEDGEEMEREEHEHHGHGPHEHGFMSGFRKFLNHF